MAPPTTLRAHGPKCGMPLPGEEVKRLLERELSTVESYVPTKSPEVLHDNTTFVRKPNLCGYDGLDDNKSLEMVMELLNNAIDPSVPILEKHPKDIRVRYDKRHKRLVVLYKDELLMAVMATSNGFRLLNPGKPFEKQAYRSGNGNKQGDDKGGGGYNYGMKQAAHTAVELGFELKFEFALHLGLDSPQLLKAGVGADTTPGNENCMCSWIRSKGGKDSFTLDSSLPLVETVLEIDEDHLPDSDLDDVKKKRVEWVHMKLCSGLCRFEFMYDVDLETPATDASPLFGGHDVYDGALANHYGQWFPAHILHRNRYNPRVPELWTILDDDDEPWKVELPPGFQLVLKQRMYDLTSSRHRGCNTLAKPVPNAVMRLPGKGFKTRVTRRNGRVDVFNPIADVFDNEHRIACTFWVTKHFKKILGWTMFNGAQPEVTSAQLLPMLRGGETTLLGDCQGALFDTFGERYSYEGISKDMKKRETGRLKKLREFIAYAALRADAHARGEAPPDDETMTRLLENEPLLYPSDKAAEDGPRARYFARVLDTCAIEAAVDDANSKLFPPSSLNVDAAKKRVAAKVAELAAEDEAKYAPPDALRDACAYVYGTDTKLYYVPCPDSAVEPYDLRDKSSNVIIVHQRSDLTVAMQNLMEFGKGKEEVNRLLELQAAMSTGKAECWQRPVSDAVRALVDGLPDAPKRQEGYTSETETKPDPKPDPSKGKRKRDEPPGGEPPDGKGKGKKPKPPEPDPKPDPKPGPSGGGGGIGPVSETDTDTDDDECVVIDPTEVKYQHAPVDGGYKPCHTCKRGKKLKYLKQEPFEVEGVVVHIPVDQPYHKHHPELLFACYKTYERVLGLVKDALEARGEWGGHDGKATEFVASFAPNANWGGYWDGKTKQIWINIGQNSSPQYLGGAICHEIAHHNTYGKEYDPHGEKHGAETERLRDIVCEHHRLFRMG